MVAAVRACAGARRRAPGRTPPLRDRGRRGRGRRRRRWRSRGRSAPRRRLAGGWRSCATYGWRSQAATSWRPGSRRGAGGRPRAHGGARGEARRRCARARRGAARRGWRWYEEPAQRAALGRPAGPLRGLLPLGHRSRERRRGVDPLHAARAGEGERGAGGEPERAGRGPGEPTCSLWLMAMDPAAPGAPFGRKPSFPVAALSIDVDPVPAADRRRRAQRRGHDRRVRGVGWDLHWAATPGRSSTSIRCCAARGSPRRCSSLPHADFERQRHAHPARGRIARGRGRARRTGAPVGLQARRPLGLGRTATTSRPTTASRAPDALVDGVSVFVPRFGREVGPSTPVVGRFGGRDFASTLPLAVMRNDSAFSLTSWRFEARDRSTARSWATSTRGARTSSASPTTTPTAIWPTATTARSRPCGSRS